MPPGDIPPPPPGFQIVDTSRTGGVAITAARPRGWWERAYDTVFGPDTALGRVFTNPAAALSFRLDYDRALDKNAVPLSSAPLVKLSELESQSDPRTVTEGARRGLLEGLEGFTSPQGLTMLYGLGRMAKLKGAGQAAAAAIGAGFDADMIIHAVREVPEAKALWEAGQQAEAARVAVRSLLSFGLGAYGAVHKGKALATRAPIVEQPLTETETATARERAEAMGGKELKREVAKLPPGAAAVASQVVAERKERSVPADQGQPSSVLPRKNRAQRRAEVAPPETGQPEEDARQADGRDNVARELTGRRYSDLDAAERSIVDGYVREGYGSVRPAAEPAGEPTAAPAAEQPSEPPATEETAPPPAAPARNAQRQARRPVIYGADTQLQIPGENRSYRAVYVLRHREDIRSSHNAQNFEPDPEYPYVNDRNYSEPRNAERIVKQTGEYEPSYLVNNNPDAVNGPPIEDQWGNTLGGNSRDMTQQRIGPEARAGYRDLAVREASKFGMRPDEVRRAIDDGYELRRMIVDDIPDAQRLITDLNKTGTAELTAGERAIADSKRISAPTLEYLQQRIEEQGPEGTLAQALEGRGGVDILNRLTEDGIVTQAEKPRLMNSDGSLTPEGKGRVARLMVGRLFEDAQQLEGAAPELKQKLERAIAPLARVAGREGWDIADQVKEAVGLAEEARRRGLSIDDLVKQRGMFGGAEYGEHAIAIAGKLQGKLTDIARAFRQYANEADLARDEQPMLGMEPPTPADAFEAAFGARPAEESFLQKLDREGKAAQQRLRARGVGTGGTLSANEFLNPATIADMARAIAGDIARGVLKLEDLTARLVKEYGPRARVAAERVWDEAQRLLKPGGARGHGDDAAGFARDLYVPSDRSQPRSRDEHFAEGRWELTPARRGRPPMLRVNRQALDMINDAIDRQSGGARLNPEQVGLFADAIRDRADVLLAERRIGPETAGQMRELARAFDEAADPESGAIYYLSERSVPLWRRAQILREEFVHARQGELLADKQKTATVRARVFAHPAFEKARAALHQHPLYRNAPMQTVLHEVTAKIAAGVRGQVGLSFHEADSLLKTYYKALAETYGEAAADRVLEYADREGRKAIYGGSRRVQAKPGASTGEAQAEAARAGRTGTPAEGLPGVHGRRGGGPEEVPPAGGSRRPEGGEEPEFAADRLTAEERQPAARRMQPRGPHAASPSFDETKGKILDRLKVTPEVRGEVARRMDEWEVEHPGRRTVTFDDVREEARALNPALVQQLDAKNLKPGETLNPALRFAARETLNGIGDEIQRRRSELAKNRDNWNSGKQLDEERKIDDLEGQAKRLLDVLIPTRSQDGRNLAYHAMMAEQSFAEDYWIGRARKAAGGTLNPEVESEIRETLAEGREAVAAAEKRRPRKVNAETATTGTEAETDTEPAAPPVGARRNRSRVTVLPSSAEKVERAVKRTIAGIERKAAGEPEAGPWKLTPEERAAVDADPRVQAARAKLAQQMMKIERTGVLDTISALRRAGLLTGVKTHLRNLGGNLSFQVLEEVSRIPAAIADSAMALFSHRRTTSGPDPRAVGRASYAAATRGIEEARQIMRDGATAADLARFDAPREINSGVGVIDKYVNFVFRTMSAEDRVFKRYAYERSLQEQMKLAKTDAPTEAMRAQAIADAEFATFNNRNAAAEGLKRFKSALHPAARFAVDTVVPFANTPANILARVIDYSGGGLGKAVVNGARALGTRKLTPEQQRAIALNMGRGLTGPALITMGYLLAKAGVMTGLRSEQRSESDRDEAVGRMPGSLLVGGTWHQVSSFSPAGNLLAIGASLFREPATEIAAQVLKEQPLLKATEEVQEALKGRQWKRAAGSMAGSFVPTIVSDAASLGDSSRRDTTGETTLEEIRNGIMSRLPGARNRLPERVDALGRTLPQSKGAAVDPTIGSEARERTDDVARELVKHDVGLTKVRRKAGESIDEFYMRRRVTGRLIEDELRQLVNREEYQALAAEERAIALEEAVRDGRETWTRIQKHPDFAAMSVDQRQAYLNSLMQ